MMGLLKSLDLNKSYSKEKYKEKKKELDIELLKCQLNLRDTGKKAIVLFEGWDAAGKGGAIKRLTEPLDPRGFRVVQISAPTVDEKEKHYLWRFWTRVPSVGKIVIFDRSWYGRVCVERIEGFCAETEWRRAYEEINCFEKNLFDDKTTVIKFFIHISKEEQEKRFKERMENPLKRYKIGKEDFRNREKWEQYYEAYEDMFRLTHTPYAPWVVVEGNDKDYARIKVIRTVVERLKEDIK